MIGGGVPGTPARRATVVKRSRKSSSLMLSTSVPGQRVCGAAASDVVTCTRAIALHGLTRGPASIVPVRASASSMTMRLSTGPTRASTAVSPAKLKRLCALTTKIVSPECGAAAWLAATMAAQAARLPAAGPAT